MTLSWTSQDTPGKLWTYKTGWINKHQQKNLKNFKIPQELKKFKEGKLKEIKFIDIDTKV